MQPEVLVLPQTLINKIAAGEVIVRPASAVKETVENSFDAGARHIRVEASRDARSIAVSDDGCGMDAENAKRAVLRHTTSKIREFDDLMALSTRGFRGEALASIIAVSRFEMLTRRTDAMAGTRLLASGGRIEKVESVGTAPGTTIRVRELFYNTPARLKFLKSSAAEFGAIVYLLMQHALSRPDVALRCARENEVHFDLPAGQELRARVENLLGSGVRGALIPVEFERHGVAVRGFVSRPEASRKDRKWQFLTVNGRPIATKQLAYPIQEAYEGLLMKQRFPVAVLDIAIDPAEVDVNVHPTKEEVRFEEERKVAGILHRAVAEALTRHDLVPSLQTAVPETPVRPQGPTGSSRGDDISRTTLPPPSPATDPSLPFVFSPTGTIAPHRPSKSDWPNSAAQTQRDFVGISPSREAGRGPGAHAGAESLPASGALGQCAGPEEEPADSLAPPSGARLSLADGPPAVPLGQIGRSYIVAEWGEDLLLIDQHAAHERLIYQRLKDRPRASIPIQPLLAPVVFELSADETEAAEALLPVFAEMGIEMRKEDDRTFSVGSLPSDMDSIPVESVVRDVLDDMACGSGRNLGIEELRDRVRVRMACRGAVKAGQSLSAEEIAQLVQEIASARLSFTCPHGRPTMVVLRKDQLHRQFGRR